jgi:hypothetical protein
MTSRYAISRAALVGVLTAVLLGACTTSPPEPTPTPATTTAEPSPTPTTSPTASIDPTTAAAQAAVLAAYQGYWDVMVRILEHPDPFDAAQADLWSELDQYAIDTAKSDLFSTAFQMSDGGVAMKGEPVLDPVVADLVVGSSASISDCVDSSNWQPVDASTGESVAAPGQAKRVTAAATLVFQDDRWVVSSYKPNRDETC